jgi:hypothetical protein
MPVNREASYVKRVGAVSRMTPDNGRVTLHEWWAWIELNYRPRAYQARALTN